MSLCDDNANVAGIGTVAIGTVALPNRHPDSEAGGSGAAAAEWGSMGGPSQTWHVSARSVSAFNEEVQNSMKSLYFFTMVFTIFIRCDFK